jgi:hypothetical protein
MPSQAAGTGLRPFGPFTRVEPLSEQGAMGVVARGYNAAFDRWELLKFLRPELSDDPELVRQFFREGRVLAKISHPNVVQVFAIYTLDGRPCLAMEFLEGKSLQALATEAGGRLPLARWHELFLGAARGLAAAHELGLLHRDIKPENLFVAAGRAGAPGGLKLIDFGLATIDRTHRQGRSADAALVAGTSGGTPLYMAPELWRGEEASARSDLYALGISFYVALTGRLPFPPVEDGRSPGSAEPGRDLTLPEVVAQVCSDEPFPDVRESRPEVPAPLALALERTMAKRKEDRLSTADDLVTALLAASSAARPRKVPGSGPYRGLLAYGPAERDVFFGRERESAEVLERMRSFPGVVLAGPSGSGKTSLALAGLAPLIEEGALGEGVTYGVVVLEPGARPVASLAAALAPRMGRAEREIVAFLRRQPASLGEALRAELRAGSGVLLVIDRLEGLASVDPAEARDFATAIDSLLLLGSAPLRVLATLRADRMDPLFAIEPLRSLLTRGFYPVRPLAGEALRRAMTEPALAAGFRLEEPGIVDEVAADLAKQPTALPLLSFAMSVWWEAREESAKLLPAAAWRSIGGVAGALTRHADQVLESMSEDEQRAADQLLVRLVSAEGTRTRVARALLLDTAASGPNAPRALERLFDAKLVVESAEGVELAHEALIARWPRLRALLVSSGDDRAFRERVAAAARQWDVQGRPTGALWSDEQALRLMRWFATTNAALDQVELAFIEAVRLRATRLRLVLRAGIASTVMAALAFGLVATANEREMERRLEAANARAAENERAYKHAESRRLKGVAAANLDRDPTASLRLAEASYELEHDPSLDVLAWDARTRGIAVPLPRLRPRRGPSGPTYAIRFAPQTGYLAAASAGAVLVLAPKSAEHVTIEADQGAIRSMDFSPDGETLALGTNDGEISAARAPAFVRQPLGHGCTGPVFAIWATSSKSVLARCRDAVVQVAPNQSAAPVMLDGEVGGAAMARELRELVVITRAGQVTFVDEEGKSRRGPTLKTTADVTAVDVSAKGDWALVGESGGDVLSAALGDGTSALLERNNGPVVAVSRGPSGAMLSIVHARGGSSEWIANLTAGGSTSAFDVGEPAFAWLESRRAVALVERSGSVEVLSLETREPVGELRSPEQRALALASDELGQWLIAGGPDASLQAFDLDQATVAITQGPVMPPPIACALSWDGAAAGCTSAASATVRVLAHSAGVLRPASTFALRGPDHPERLALGPSGKPLFVFEGGGVAREERAPVPLLLKPSLASTTGDRVVVAGENLEGLAAIEFLPFSLDSRPTAVALPARATALAWVDTARSLYAAGADGHVRRVDPSAGKIVDDVAFVAEVGTRDAITSVAATDDMAGIAIGTQDGRVYARVTGKKAATELPRLDAPVTCLAWARSGHALVASAGKKAFVVGLDVGAAFSFWRAPALIAQCARSPDQDRFSFVGIDGTAWVMALDLSGVAESYVPPDPAAPEAAPAPSTWKGLPVGLVH